MHERKTGCKFQKRLVLWRNGLLFPFALTEKALPSLALSAVKTQEGLTAVSKGLCFRAWLRRQCGFLSLIALGIFVPESQILSCSLSESKLLEVGFSWLIVFLFLTISVPSFSSHQHTPVACTQNKNKNNNNNCHAPLVHTLPLSQLPTLEVCPPLNFV